MPPKARFTREEITAAALNLAEREGIDALTARALGEELGCSSRPVFTVFDSMDEVREEVTAAAYAIYHSYEDEFMNEENAFKGSGKGYIYFAADHPKLFRFLFMNASKSIPDIESVLENIDGYYGKILNCVQSLYGCDGRTAKEIYLHLWIYSHGIATLTATGVCSFTKEQVEEMLGTVGAGIISKYRADRR